MTTCCLSLDTIVSLVLGVPIGLVSGLYTGLIVTRYTRFAELRNEVLRLIRTIEFMQNGEQIDIENDRNVPKLALISSDLLFLGHHKAGETITKLWTEMSKINYEAKHGRIGIVEYSKYYSDWQKLGRKLPGSKRVLWGLSGRM